MLTEYEKRIEFCKSVDRYYEGTLDGGEYDLKSKMNDILAIHSAKDFVESQFIKKVISVGLPVNTGKYLKEFLEHRMPNPELHHVEASISNFLKCSDFNKGIVSLFQRRHPFTLKGNPFQINFVRLEVSVLSNSYGTSAILHPYGSFQDKYFVCSTSSRILLQVENLWETPGTLEKDKANYTILRYIRYLSSKLKKLSFTLGVYMTIASASKTLVISSCTNNELKILLPYLKRTGYNPFLSVLPLLPEFSDEELMGVSETSKWKVLRNLLSKKEEGTTIHRTALLPCPSSTKVLVYVLDGLESFFLSVARKKYESL